MEASRPTVETIVVPKPEPPSTIPETIIPLTYNESVQKNINFFTQKLGRKFMKISLERTGRWFDFIKRIAREENAPEEIAHLAIVESGLNPNAFSRARAVGMWQFMQPTGEEYDLNVTYWIDERRDPEKSTRAAMRFLKDLFNDLGDWQLALAAYNCGGGNVRRAIRKSGIEKPNFWQIQPFLPRETQQYVPGFIAATLIVSNRELYGFPDDSLRFHEPFRYESAKITEPVQLSVLARCCDIPVDSLKKLNPELVRGCTPPTGTYLLKLYPGTAEAFHKRYAMLTDQEKRPWVNHKVARGETLASISRRYGVSGSEIAEVNGLSGYKTKLRRGSNLRVPVTSRGAEPAELAITTKVVTPPAAEKSQVLTSKYVVRSGDNISSIARKSNVRIADVRNWNNLPYDQENIRIGDTLIVSITDSPIKKGAAIERLAITRTIEHKVRKGETLTALAEAYGTTPERIRQLNRLKPKSVLIAGVEIDVETSVTKSRVADIQASTFLPSQPKASLPRNYKVKAGDTLQEIADRFGVTIESIRAKNASLRKSTVVRKGQTIRLR